MLNRCRNGTCFLLPFSVFLILIGLISFLYPFSGSVQNTVKHFDTDSHLFGHFFLWHVQTIRFCHSIIPAFIDLVQIIKNPLCLLVSLIPCELFKERILRTFLRTILCFCNETPIFSPFPSYVNQISTGFPSNPCSSRCTRKEEGYTSPLISPSFLFF